MAAINSSGLSGSSSSNKTSKSDIFISSAYSSFIAWMSALEYSGDSSSLISSGRVSIRDSFADPYSMYSSFKCSEYPPMEKRSLMRINLDT